MRKFFLLTGSLVLLQACAATMPSLPLQLTRKQDGAWISQFRSGMGEAVTGNDSGSTFGLMCTALDCNYYFTTDVNCDPGGSYPGLINFDDEVEKITLGCRAWKYGSGKEINIVWLDFSQRLHQNLATTKNTAMVFPMKGGSFKVMHFKLEGYPSAAQRVIAALNPQSLRPEGPKDSVR